MNKLLQFAMLGAGGWLLWDWFQSRPPGGASTPANGADTNGSAPATTPAPPATTLQLMQAAAAAEPTTWHSTMTAHQWNYLYNVVRQRTPPAPPPELTGAVTLQEWWDTMQPLGVSGLTRRGIAGLRSGYIGHRHRRYA